MNDLLTRLRAPTITHTEAHEAMLEAANELERLMRVANLLPPHDKTPAWKQRQDFITAHIDTHGKINSTFLMLAFKISKAQAQIDLARWQRNFPGCVTYDPTSKTFVSTRTT